MKGTRLALAGSVVTTLIAGLYFVVYIYRWEMHRALIAGVVFLAGEIAVATALVIRRIDALLAPAPAAVAATPSPASPTVASPATSAASPDVAADATSAPVAEPTPAPAPAPAATAPLSAPNRAKPAPFPWLGADRFGVFVPILLGAGTIVSGVAWVVEHLARNTGSSGAVGGRLERRLAALTPPPLVTSAAGGVAMAAPGASTGGDHGRRGRTVRRVAAALLVGGLAAVLLTLALLGRSRTDPPAEGTRSVITVEVKTRNGVDVDVAARSLWGSCHVWVPSQQLTEMRVVQPGVYELVLEPSLGDQAERRLFGCLNDGTLERVNAVLRSHERIAVTDG